MDIRIIVWDVDDALERADFSKVLQILNFLFS